MFGHVRSLDTDSFYKTQYYVQRPGQYKRRALVTYAALEDNLQTTGQRSVNSRSGPATNIMGCPGRFQPWSVSSSVWAAGAATDTQSRMSRHQRPLLHHRPSRLLPRWRSGWASDLSLQQSSDFSAASMSKTKISLLVFVRAPASFYWIPRTQKLRSSVHAANLVRPV